MEQILTSFITVMISCYVPYFQKHLSDSVLSNIFRSLEEPPVGVAQRKETESPSG